MKEEKFKISQETVEELKKRIEKLESSLEKEKGFEKKEKAVKQEIKSYLQELQQTPSFAPPITTRDEVKEIIRMETSQQIGALISLALEKGLSKAISVAQAINNPAILDEFHDTLVDRYYEALIEKGILKF
jgi:hypothetical protein